MECSVFALDDDAVVLKSVATALSSLGPVEATSLWSGLSASLLRHTRTGLPALLVCDLDMPGIAGADFCRVVRRHCPTTSIIIFTSDPARAPKDLCDAVVSKRDGVRALHAAAVGLVARQPGARA